MKNYRCIKQDDTFILLYFQKKKKNWYSQFYRSNTFNPNLYKKKTKKIVYEDISHFFALIQKL
ncbi:hypothetical protein BD770DRAFT_399685 [Pilaira anomala]|nr:hypothetical protein BD770DRAFT_399685 [Pilaira anomala]